MKSTGVGASSVAQRFFGIFSVNSKAQDIEDLLQRMALALPEETPTFLPNYSSLQTQGPMQADIDAKDQNQTASPPEKCAGDERATKLIECPFVVSIDGVVHEQFYDVRDAMASARAAKRDKLSATVVVTDVRTGKLLIEVRT
jgi:hypothetical protein